MSSRTVNRSIGRSVDRYVGVNAGEDWIEEATRRHGDANQSDWEMHFLSCLTMLLSFRPFDAGEYEVREFAWKNSWLRLVVELWHGDTAGLVGWQVHLPTVRSSFCPDGAVEVAHAWWTGEFHPCYLPVPHLPGNDGIHWRGRPPL